MTHNIIKWNGETITKPGIYVDLPISVYHEQCCDGPSVSSSGLRVLEQKTPAHFYAGWSGNPDYEKPESAALDFGKAAHALLLGDDHFDQSFAMSPYPDFRKKEAQEWKAEQIAAGKTVLTADMVAKIKAMGAALARNSMVKNGLLDGQTEHSLIWKDEQTGVWLKARPDLLPLANWIADYKTTMDASAYRNEKAIHDRGYHMQLALVAEGMCALDLVNVGSPLEYALIFQEKDPPYCVVGQEVDPDWVWRGAQQNRRAIQKFAECIESGDWPGYDVPSTARAPEWFNEIMQRDEDANLLPLPSPVFEKVKGHEV